MTQDLPGGVQDFVRHLVAAVSNATLYAIDHPQVARNCSAALSSLNKSLIADGEVSLIVIDSELIYNGLPLGGGLYAARFVRMLADRGIGHLKLVAGITLDEVRNLVLSLRKQGGGREVCSTDHVRFGTVEIHFSQGADTSSLLDEVRNVPELAEIPTEEILRLTEIYEGVKKNRKLKMAGIFEIVEGFIRTFRNEADPLLAISPLKAIDEYTFTHSTNVCILNLSQAMALGIEGQQLHDIGIAAMLHDIGKLFIPEEILTKPGKLTDAEWEIVRQHPLKGAQYLLNTPGVPNLAVVTAYEHHMKYDFSGYPRAGSDWQQHICSQMTTISDMFDALWTKRSYRGSADLEAIAETLLEKSGTELNPHLVRNFFGILVKVKGRAGIGIEEGG